MSLSLRPFSSLARAVLFQKNTVALPTGYLFGLTLSPAGSTSLPIAAGNCRDSTDADNMVPSAITKTTGSWVAGTGNGGLDTGSIAASTWYHAFAIKTVAGLGGSTDALISLSPTSPTMPTGYSLKRRIGSVFTDGSKNFTAVQQDGDHFRWTTAGIRDVNAANPGTSAVTRTLSVPTGVVVWADITVFQSAGSSSTIETLITSLDETDRAASASDFNFYVGNATTMQVGVPMMVKTNTSSQIRSRQSASGASDTFIIVTYGWWDQRGRQY